MAVVMARPEETKPNPDASERLSDRVARASVPARGTILPDGSVLVEFDVYPLETSTELPRVTYREPLLQRLFSRRREAKRRAVARRSAR